MSEVKDCEHDYQFSREFDTEELVGMSGGRYVVLCKHKMVYKCIKCKDLRIIE